MVITDLIIMVICCHSDVKYKIYITKVNRKYDMMRAHLYIQKFRGEDVILKIIN